MRIGVIGVNVLSSKIKKTIESEMDRYLNSPNCEEIIFATDSITEMYAMGYCIKNRKDGKPRLSCVLPEDKIAVSDSDFKKISNLDYVEEMRLIRYGEPMSRLIELARLRVVEFSDKIVSFWDGYLDSAIYQLMSKITSSYGKELSTVKVLYK